MSSTFKIKLKVPRRVELVSSQVVDRDLFFTWAWEALSEFGIVGVHEGTMLSEQAKDHGLETESWTLDAGEAPRERDWVSNQELIDAELYFETEAGAQGAWETLGELEELELLSIEEQKAQDWDAEWKRSFQGTSTPPFWRILPPWMDPQAPESFGKQVLKVNPGAGFGTGTHETTQLCLRILGERWGRDGLRDARVLDFGSGSGILSIGAALLGAQEVCGVEIDELAIDNAEENARLNGVTDRVKFSKTLTNASGPFSVVIANILKPVLLEFAPQLIARLAPQGSVILSGLMENDVMAVSDCYSSLLGGKRPQLLELNEWRALAWLG